jgi:D-amino-acid dehydrogenase
VKKHIHIIGGGIIGLTSAWYLLEDGQEVTIIDKGDLSDGTSHGNAGMIVPSHFVPMAAPGVISQGIKWMFDSRSPFYIKPRLNADLLGWLWRFYRSCNATHVQRCMPVLYDFNEWSKQLYKAFSQEDDFSFCFEEKGLLMLYKTKHQEEEEAEMAHKANQLNISAEVLSATALEALEPDIALDVRGGVYFEGDAHLYPNRFIHQLQRQLQARGATFMTGTEVVDMDYTGGQISKLTLSDRTSVTVDQVVLSGGSWTALLLKKLGVNIHLQDGKGYSFTIKNATTRPRIPTILTESKVAVTPMGDDLRIGGTLELGGLSSTVNKKRLEGIINSLPKYYPQLQVSPSDLENIWVGYRPCSADGMPYIGRTKALTNLIVATGHGMMGMSMGPATGKLVSQIVNDQDTSLDLSLFAIER